MRRLNLRTVVGKFLVHNVLARKLLQRERRSNLRSSGRVRWPSRLLQCSSETSSRSGSKQKPATAATAADSAAEFASAAAKAARAPAKKNRTLT